ncbi:Carbohydrate kinase, FGGY family [hydrothermal vent metagenome]|uniref:Carbohydrate kinase, FGGY family n=1 Tax=hydrothermal vent metagenome TaxID=652676 RepID=A0A3B0Y6D7_9ZZZZ
MTSDLRPPALRPCYIGIDLGTSGVRACAIDSDESIIHTCATPLPGPHKHGKSITQEAQLWWQATSHVLSELLSHTNAAQVRAISVNGTSGTVLACDNNGTPLAPARMYNDSYCAEQAALIKRIAPDTSAAHGNSSGLAKLLYLQQLLPQATHLLHQADWIAGKLCGRFDFSDENNALKSGYDPVQGQWPDWLAQTGLKIDSLPKVLPPGSAIATIQNKQSEKFNLAPDCQIISGTTDSIAAFIATGANTPGDAVTSLGSTLVLKVIAEKPIFAPQYGIYSHKLGNFWLPGGASNSGGAVLSHYFTPQQIDELSHQINPDKPTSLDYYPLLQPGERFPFNNPRLEPRLTPRPEKPVDFFQAILQGISQIELQGYNRLQQLGATPPSQVLTAGGGSKNTAWNRMRQLTLGIPVKQAIFSEACYGSALLAKRGYTA